MRNSKIINIQVGNMYRTSAIIQILRDFSGWDMQKKAGTSESCCKRISEKQKERIRIMLEKLKEEVYKANMDLQNTDLLHLHGEM